MLFQKKQDRSLILKQEDTLLVLGDEEQGLAVVKADVMKELAVKILKGLGKLNNDIDDKE